MSVANYNKNSNDTTIPNAETGLSRIKACPVVEDKATPKLQSPMWPGPEKVVTADAATADAWSLVRRKKGKSTATNHKAGIASAHDHGTPAVECSSTAAVDPNAACGVGTESRTVAASSTINIINNTNKRPPTTAAEGSSAEARVALAIANSDAVAAPSNPEMVARSKAIPRLLQNRMLYLGMQTSGRWSPCGARKIRRKQLVPTTIRILLIRGQHLQMQKDQRIVEELMIRTQ